ncbi:nitrogen regulation protein NIFR3 [Staphylococcus aureus]|nr:nitrogen regulation protein NIFR3 [Staphylococcus aureus]
MMIESGTSQCPRLYNVILAGPQHREIGTPISTGNGSWRGPNIENFNKEIQPAMEVGVNKLIL